MIGIPAAYKRGLRIKKKNTLNKVKDYLELDG